MKKMAKVKINQGVAREPIAYAGTEYGMYFPMKDGSNLWVFVDNNGRADLYSTKPISERPVYKGDTIEWTFGGYDNV